MRIFFIMVQSIIGVVLGEWDGLLSALVLFMVVEYLTQILVAILDKKISSEIGFCGIAKKVSIMFLVMVGNVIDVLIIQNGSIIRTAVIFFYLSNEGITILENVAILGLPIPQKLKDILEQLKDGKK
ncbi:MAG: phage holin family protein [Lachnospiraceae bacterium]|nr:phage holin family protein [Lachnospiraceae bacterium]